MVSIISLPSLGVGITALAAAQDLLIKAYFGTAYKPEIIWAKIEIAWQDRSCSVFIQQVDSRLS